MSPLRRRERATAKQRAGRGRHARPAVQAGQSQVPEELRPVDYEFPRVELPQFRPGATRQVLSQLGQMDWAPGFSGDDTQVLLPGELLERLADPDHESTPRLDDDTQPLPVAGVVVDETPQPAHHDGLAPAHAPVIPVPTNPFLNAHPPRHAAAPVPAAVASVDGLVAEMRGRGLPTEPVSIHIGNALPARLTDYELANSGRPIAADTPAAPSLRAALPVPEPVRRSEQYPFVFGSFDGEFWAERNAELHSLHDGYWVMAKANDEASAALGEHLAVVDGAHQRAILRVAAAEYRGHLADATRPLPHRTPGAALSAIEASRGQLVAR